jgi:D-beta-D-heptose 7-phosphate kinase/D-beta-D-heptose 1-phosphate adenosyltransferase
MFLEPTTRVWINGTFDVVHLGHIKLFQLGKLQLEFPHNKTNVRVGIDDDSRVQSMKGPNRPINPLSNRIEFLKSIRFVDEVVHFSSDDELRAKIREYSPHIMCIGEEYRNRTIIGEEFVQRVIYVDKFLDLSTTTIVSGG